MILFLLAYFYWITPNGYIVAYPAKPSEAQIKGFDGHYLVQDDKFYSSRCFLHKDGKFVQKSPLKFKLLADTVYVEEGKGTTEVTLFNYVKGDTISIENEKVLTYEVNEKVKKSLKQAWTVKAITIVNETCFPMRYDTTYTIQKVIISP